MGKKTIINFSKIFLLLISSILLAYLLLIENGINPKINHLLNKNIYFWIIVIITSNYFGNFDFYSQRVRISTLYNTTYF